MKKINNVLIVGGGISGESFVKSLSFYEKNNIVLSSNNNKGKTIKVAKNYDIPFYGIGEIVGNGMIEDFNYILICSPPGTKLELVNLFIKNKFRGNLLLEKPLSLNTSRAIAILDILKEYEIYSLINFQRRIMSRNYFIKIKSNSYKIIWPVSNYIKVNLIIHILPHILDVLIMIEGISMIYYSDYKIINNKLFVYGKVNNKSFEICVFRTRRNELPTVNNQEVTNPNLLISRKLMFEKLIEEDEQLMKDIFLSSLQITKFIERISYEIKKETL